MTELSHPDFDNLSKSLSIPMESLKTMYDLASKDPRMAAFNNEQWFVSGAAAAEFWLGNMTEETIDDVKQAYALLFKAHGAIVKERDELASRVKELEAEVLDQCRLNGMGAERESALMSRVRELESVALSTPAQQDAVDADDPLQGAVDWLLQADGEFFCVATVQRTLRIGYNRANRLSEVAKERAAISAKKGQP